MKPLSRGMRCASLCAAVALSTGVPRAEEGGEGISRPARLRVLTIGCSFSVWNGWPHVLGEMLVAGGVTDAFDVFSCVGAGKPLVAHAKDGGALKMIENPPSGDRRALQEQVAELRRQRGAAPGDRSVLRRLREAEARLAQCIAPGWDYVFLLFFTQDYEASDEEITRVLKGLVDPILARGAKPMVWLPWGGIADLRRYIPIARELKIPIVPVSFAEQLRSERGEIAAKTRVHWPGGHPDALTEYTYACTFYAAMTGRSPEGLPIRVIPGSKGPPVRRVERVGEPTADLAGAHTAYPHDVELSEEVATFIQRAAWQAIRELRKLQDSWPPIRWSREENLLWACRLPGRALSGPAAQGGTVHAMTARGLACVRDGRCEWTGEVLPAAGRGEATEPSPAAHGGRVYASVNAGALACFDAAGKRLWQAPVEPDGTSGAAVSSPLPCGDLILVQGRHLEAFGATDGNRLWRTQAPEAARPCAPATCRLRDGVIVLTSWGAALRAEDGGTLAEKLSGPAGCSPVVVDQMAYFCGANRRGEPSVVTACRLPEKAGAGLAIEKAWTRSLDADCSEALLVEQGLVYLLDAEQTLRAMDAASGAVLYAAPLIPAGEQRQTAGSGGSLVRAGAGVYAANVGTRNRTVIVEPERKFRKAWEYAVAETPAGAPAFEGDRQYVCAGDMLYCIGGRTPQEPRPQRILAVAPHAALAQRQDLLVAKLVDDATPKTWVALGPFSPDAAALDVPGVLSDAILKAGQTVEVHGATRTAAALDARAWFQHPKFTAGLQAIALSDVVGRTANVTEYLFAALEFDAPGYFEFRLLTPNGEIWNPPSRLTGQAWLAGRPVEDGCVLKLEKGRYPLMVRARIGECEPHGHIWMAPRLADVTAEVVRRQAEYERALSRWPKYVAESAGLFVLGE